MKRSNIKTKIISQILIILMVVNQMLFAGVGFGFVNTAKAAFTPQINYQGKLTDASDVAVADGSYNMRFRLCSDSSCNSVVWTETYCFSPDNGATCDGTGTDQRISVINGIFSVMLGSINSLSGVDFNQNLWLGVEIGGSGTTPVWDGEMTPRKRLGAVPAAFVADTLDGIDSTSFLRSDQADTMSANSASTLFTVNQTGTGNIFEAQDGGSSVFAITDGGQIGVATTTPQANLSVAPAAGALIGNQLLFQVATTTSVGTITNSLVVTAAGNVGIGTVNPQYALDISGALRVSGATIFNGVSYIWPSADGSSGQVLTTDGAGNLSWSTVSGGSTGSPGAWETLTTNVLTPTNTAAGIFVRASSTIGASATTTGTFAIGEALKLNGDYIADLTGTGLIVSGGALQTTLGTSVDLTSEVTGILPVANGGTGASSLAAGSILIGNGTSPVTSTSTLSVNVGGTGAATFTQYGIVYGNGTSPLQATAAAANSVLVTNASNVPSLSQVLPSAVQVNITQLGTITAGVWQGTAIDPAYLDPSVIISTEIDTSAELAAIVTDETGSGALVFGTNPTISGAILNNLTTISDARISVLNATTSFVDTLTVSTTASLSGQTILSDARATVINATSTVTDSLTIGADTITDITGTNLTVSGGALSVTGVAPQGTPGAWETLTTNVLTPTNTAAGIFVRASSTIGASATTTGSFSAGDTLFVKKDSGFVGVGTQNPGAYLDIITTAGDWSNYRLRVMQSGASTPDLVVTNVGTVGIGTTGTLFKLQVAGSVGPDSDNTYYLGNTSRRWAAIYSTAGYFGSGTGGGWLSVSPPAGGGGSANLALQTISGQTGDLIIWKDSNGTTLGVLDVSGNLGLGTASPGATLQVTGAYTPLFVSATSGKVAIFDTAFQDGYGLTVATTTYISATTTIGSNTLSVNTNESRVGINVANPDSPLEVRDALNNNFINFENSQTSVYIGYQSGQTATSSYSNTALGYRSLANVVYNSDVGYTSGGSNNTAIGDYALYQNTIGYKNTAVGASALRNNTTGSRNTAVGFIALENNTTGVDNTAMGYYALTSNTTGSGNVALGSLALRRNTTGNDNVAIGPQALQGSTSGTTGSDNVAIGDSAMYQNTTGSWNVALGSWSMYYNTVGYRNVAMGYYAMSGNREGYSNVGIGVQALGANNGGIYNVGIGDRALYEARSATSTVAIGVYSGYGAAAYSNQGGVYVGYQAGYRLSDNSDYNTFIGYRAGYDVTTGQRNIILGPWTTTGVGITTGSNNILIGDGVRYGLSQTGSNQLNIGNLLFGTGISSGTTLSSGSIGIGTASPAYRLHVVSNATTTAFIQGGLKVEGSATTTDYLVIGSGGTVNTLDFAGGDLYVQDALEVDGLSVFTDIRTPVINATSTVTDSLTIGADTITDITGTNLTVSGGALSVTGVAPQGTPGAWETLTTNVLTPTNTAAGIFVRASSTIGASATTTGNFTANDTLYVKDGKVGIGTQSPGASVGDSATVEIAENGANIPLLITKDSANGSVIKMYNNNNYLDISIGQLASGPVTFSNFRSGGDYLPFLFRGYDFRVNVGSYGSNSEALRVANTGKVGIATTTPQANLSVAPAAGALIGNQLLFQVATTTSVGTITNSLVVTAAGNVGIGTVNPQYALDISGALRVSGATIFNGVSYIWPSADGSSGQVLTTDGAGNLSWSTVSGGSTGSPGAWETLTTNVLTPTNTAAGIFVRASSTIAASATTTGTFAIGEALKLNGDYISDLTGTGLQLNAGSLETTLGISVDLTSEVTGILPVANGGTGASSITTNALIYGQGTSAVAEVTPAANSVLITNASNVPSLSQTLPSAVQGNITQLGTITAGVWQGTAIDPAYLDPSVIISTEIDTSAELAAIVTDETGSGALVFGTLPTLSGATLNSLTTIADARIATLNATSTLIDTLTVAGTATLQGQTILTDARTPVINATSTVTDSLTIGTDTITDITGTNLTVSGGALSVTGVAPQGTPGAWETLTTNVLTPTNTAAGIFVRASSTIAANATTTGNFTANDTLFVKDGKVSVGTPTSTDLFRVGTSTQGNLLVVDAATGYVGIGTDNPLSRLEVNGDILLSDGAARTIKVDNSVSGAGYDLTISAGDYSSSGSGGGDLVLRGGNGYFGYSGATLTLGGSGFNAGVFTLQGGRADNNGSAGISTIQAATGGNNTAGGTLLLKGGTGGINGARGGHIYIQGGEPGGSVTTYGDVYIGVDTNGNTRGRVGIGTDLPAALLHVQRTAEGQEMLFLVGTSTSDSMFAVTNTGAVGIATTTPQANLSVAPAAGALTGNQLLFQVATTTSVGTITNSLVVTAAGNVGIGTVNPQYALDISGALRVSGATIFNGVSYIWPSADGSSGQVLTTDGAGNLSWSTVSGGSTGSPGAWETLTTNVLTPTNTAAGIFVRASSTIAASATTTGSFTASDTLFVKDTNVGIGVESASAKLHVKGGFSRVESNSGFVIDVNPGATGGLKIGFGSYLAPEDYLVIGQYNGTNNIDTQSYDLRIFSNNDSTGLTYKYQTGNFGVGITTPSAKLQVVSSNASTPAAILQGAASQTANLLEMRNNAGAFLSGFTASGGLLINIASSSAVNVQDGSGVTKFAVNTGDGSNTYSTTTISDYLAVDTNTLFVDPVNNRVGIGVSNPSQSLEVAGSVFTVAGGVFISGTDGSASLPVFTRGNDRDTGMFFYGGNKLGISTGGKDRFTIIDNGNIGIATTTPQANLSVAPAAGALTGNQLLFQVATTTGAGAITNSLVVTAAGNVGIGTQSPETQLHLDSDGTTAIRLEGFGSTMWDVRINGSTDVFEIRDAWNGPIPFKIEPNTANNTLYLDSAGVIGVNNNTPTAQLDVVINSASRIGQILQGAASQTANLLEMRNNAGTFLSGFTASGGLLINIASSTAINVQDGSGNAVFTVDTSNNQIIANDARIGIVHATSTVTDSLTIGADTITDITGTNLTVSGGALSVTGVAPQGTPGAWETLTTNVLTPTNTAAGIFVRASSTIGASATTTGNFTANDTLYVKDGKVGIGTESPVYPLDINSDSYTIANFTRSGSDASISINGGNTSRAWVALSRSADANWFLSNEGDFRIKRHPYSNNINSANILLTITEAGFVGIATTTPQANLSVAPAVGALTGNQLLFQVATTTGAGAVTDALVVDASGNVGMGTAAPLQNLHIKSTGDAVIRLEADSDNAGENDNPAIEFLQDGGSTNLRIGVEGVSGTVFTDSIANAPYIYSVNSSFPLQLAVSGRARMTLDTTGFVGIATTTPQANLSVAPAAGALTGNQLLFQVATTTGAGAVTDALVVDASGNVGIGTNNPAYKLDLIDGSFRMFRSAGNESMLMQLDGAYNTISAGNNSFKFVVEGGQLYSFNFDDDLGNRYFRIQTADGHVGVGDASPDAMLEVSASGGLSDLLMLSSDDANDGDIFIVKNSGSTGIGTASPFYRLQVVSSATTTALFEGGLKVEGTATTTGNFTANDTLYVKDGKVGIGTQSPGAALQLGPFNAGHLLLTSANNNFGWLIDTVDQGGGNVPLRIFRRTGGVDTEVITVRNQDGKVGIATTTPWAQLSVEGQGTSPGFVVSDTSNNTDFIVDASGNVGIGTASPGYDLEILGTGGVDAQLFVGSTNNTARLFLESNGSSFYRWQFLSDPNNPLLEVRHGWSNTSPLKIEGATTVGGNEDAIYITKTGSVGFSTSTPQAVLSVGPAAGKVTGTDLLFQVATTTNAGIITNSLAVTATGNVGIGTANPSAMIHASTTVDTTIGMILQGSSAQTANLLEMRNNAGAFLSGFTADGGLLINIASSTALNIQDGSGNAVFQVDSTSSEAGIDITAVAGQNANLINLYDSSSQFVSGFTAAGGLLMNIASGTAVNIQDGSGGDVFTVDTTDKQVGVGTSTPDALLHIYKDSPAANEVLFKVSTSTGGVYGNAFTVDEDGDIAYDGTASSPAADYAEYFYTTDTDLESGEVVCVDVTRDNAVKRCERASDGNVMGIVSTKPAILGNAKPDYAEDDNYVIVGMLGQVPAKVSTENGPIRPGDSLTSASLPGYIMRANPGDPTVGVALEAFMPDLQPLNPEATSTPYIYPTETGVINVLISRRNKSLTVEEVERKVQDRIAQLEIKDEVDILVSQAVADLEVEDRLLVLEEQYADILAQIEEINTVEDQTEPEITTEDNFFANITIENVDIISADIDYLKVTDKADIDNLAVYSSFEVYSRSSATTSTSTLPLVEIREPEENIGEVLIVRGDGRIEGSFTVTDVLKAGELVLGASDTTEYSDGDITLKVVESEEEDVRLLITSGAEFEGTITVERAVVNGYLTVTDGLKVEGNFEISGAIVQEFDEAEGEYLQIGDAVAIVDENKVGLAWADRDEFRPAIGIVIGIFEAEQVFNAGSQNIFDGQATSTPSSTVSAAENQEIGTAGRKVKVAVGGVIGGFENLKAGSVYYLADIETYTNNSSENTIRGLTYIKPQTEGSVVQVVGIAKSSSEFIVMPSLVWNRAGEVQNTDDIAPVNVYQYNIDSIVIDNNQGDTGQSTETDQNDLPDNTETENTEDNTDADQADGQEEVSGGSSIDEDSVEEGGNTAEDGSEVIQDEENSQSEDTKDSEIDETGDSSVQDAADNQIQQPEGNGSTDSDSSTSAVENNEDLSNSLNEQDSVVTN